MKVRAPHFLLYSDSRSAPNRPESSAVESAAETEQPPMQTHGEWQFLLESIDGNTSVEASDAEPETDGERLELLPVVRGLEALDQPSRVTLLTPSRYVNRGFRFGLPEWKSSKWRWERFGRMVPIKNRDLWERIDRAMEYHQVECRQLRFDGPHSDEGSMPEESADPSAQGHPERSSQRVG